MSYQDTFEKWLRFCDEEDRQELLALQAAKDEKEIEDRFYCDLKFGTGGMRGVMGVGSNRMNKYMIRKATKGLADYLQANCNEAEIARGVVIAYDSRHHSQEFAYEAAKVLTSAGIPVKIFSELQPTPVLSFAVKYLGALAGIVLTASHNPKEYNGYKVYDRDGDQIVPRIAGGSSSSTLKRSRISRALRPMAGRSCSRRLDRMWCRRLWMRSAGNRCRQ